MNNFHPTRSQVALCCAILSAAFAQASVVTVDCDKRNAKSIAATLATLDKDVANTVNIVGTCNEHVVIERFKDLTLVGKSGASISQPVPPPEPLPGEEGNDVLDIGPQSTVTIRSLTIDGGVGGIACFDQSSCRLEDTTVQNAAGDGVSVYRTGSRISVLGNSRLQNNGGVGLGAFAGSNVDVDLLVANGPYPTIQNNLGGGFRVWDGSFMRVVGATIQGNGQFGIDADAGATVRAVLVTITGNRGDGLGVRSSNARLTGVTITGNTGHGILMRNLSFLRFNGSKIVSGNAVSPQVSCASVTAATVGAVAVDNPPDFVIGSSNCIEPAP